jgi:hypothetical protein
MRVKDITRIAGKLRVAAAEGELVVANAYPDAEPACGNSVEERHLLGFYEFLFNMGW